VKRISSTVLFILLSTIIYAQNSKTKIAQNRFIERKNNKFGVTDSLENSIIPFIYDFIEFKNQRLVIRQNNLSGVFSLDYKELIPIEFTFIFARKKERFILVQKNARNGLSDSNGKMILPLQYKSILAIENDHFYLTKNGHAQNGVYDFNGNNIIPEEYTFYTIDQNKLFATKHNEPQILDLQNLKTTIYLDKDVVFIETTKHYTVGENFFQIVKIANKFGVINSKNETIIPIIYDEVKSSQNWNYYIIKQNGKFGLINVNGNTVKQPIYDKIELRKETIILKKKNFKDEIYTYKN
jgi:hypothetical protein